MDVKEEPTLGNSACCRHSTPKGGEHVECSEGGKWFGVSTDSHFRCAKSCNVGMVSELSGETWRVWEWQVRIDC